MLSIKFYAASSRARVARSASVTLNDRAASLALSAADRRQTDQ